MKQLIIDNLDESIFEKLKSLAQLHNRSLEDEVYDILHQRVTQTPLGSRIAKRFADRGLKDGEDIPEWRGYTAEPIDFHE